MYGCMDAFIPYDNLQGNKRSTKEFIFCKVLWEGFPPEFASCEPEEEIHNGFIDKYEAAVEAEAQLRVEEEQEAAELEDRRQH